MKKTIFSLMIAGFIFFTLNSCTKTTSTDSTDTILSEYGYDLGWNGEHAYVLAVKGIWDRTSYYIDGERKNLADLGKIPVSSFELRRQAELFARIRAIYTFQESIEDYFNNPDLYKEEEEEILYDKDGNEILIDEDGNQFIIDKDGNKIFLDEDDNRFIIDEDGNKIFLDEDDNQFIIDKNGNKIFLDEDGNRFILDEDGNKMPVIEKTIVADNSLSTEELKVLIASNEKIKVFYESQNTAKSQNNNVTTEATSISNTLPPQVKVKKTINFRRVYDKVNLKITLIEKIYSIDNDVNIIYLFSGKNLKKELAKAFIISNGDIELQK